jgi:hypothetical protein
MPLETPARPGTHSRHRLQAGYRRLRTLRAVLPYLLIAAALLGASEILWLWHSWPVRQVLEAERLIAGASI